MLVTEAGRELVNAAHRAMQNEQTPPRNGNQDMSTDLIELELRVTELAIHDDYKVASAPEAVAANDTLGTIKMLGKEVEVAKRSELDPLNNQVKAIRDKFRPAESMLERAEAVVKHALVTFQNDERKRLAEAEAKRAAQVAVEQARLRQQAEDERRRASAKAAQLLLAGQDQKAAAVMEAANLRADSKEEVAALLPAAMPTARPTALAGFSSRDLWTGEVTHTRQFLTWLLSDMLMIDLDSLISFKPIALNRLATMYKEGAKIPGFKANKEQTAAARAR